MQDPQRDELDRLQSLGLFEHKSTRDTNLHLDRCGGCPVIHLFQVVIKRARPKASQNGWDLYPVHYVFYVLAPNEAEAISQVQNMAYPDEKGCVLDLSQQENLTATATPLPLHIRGWGEKAF